MGRAELTQPVARGVQGGPQHQQGPGQLPRGAGAPVTRGKVARAGQGSSSTHRGARVVHAGLGCHSLPQSNGLITLAAFVQLFFGPFEDLLIFCVA